jgi:hypothetical protein
MLTLQLHNNKVTQPQHLRCTTQYLSLKPSMRITAGSACFSYYLEGEGYGGCCEAAKL